MHHSNEMNTEVCVHGRQNTSWLETEFDESVNQS